MTIKGNEWVTWCVYVAGDQGHEGNVAGVLGKIPNVTSAGWGGVCKAMA